MLQYNGVINQTNSTANHDTAMPQRDGIMLVISSPSGAGKTTLSRALLQNHPDLKLSVSVTTRAPRDNEIEGVHYHFVSDDVFQTMIDNDEFLEYATVFKHRYGTPRKQIEQTLDNGYDVMFDIDWNGTQQLKENANNPPITVFILPPSKMALQTRLKSRAADSDEAIAYRMAQAPAELSHYQEYDYIIINDDLNHSLAQLEAILTAERTKRIRYKQLASFVKNIST
ncbi:MAG: guanylate kinase [Alphaproteobacteria bacterium]|nr:guanylate kinase [Alphaproteobacteria bacterium]